MSKFNLISKVVIGLLFIGFAARAQSRSSRTVKQPNIIIILTDDMGVGDVGAFGGKVIATPNIDQLAKEGMKLT